MDAAVTYRALWWTSFIALGVVILRVWHVLLLKQTVHSPVVLVGWLALAWGLIGLGLALERWSAGHLAVPSLWRRLTAETWAVLALGSVLLLLFDAGFMRAASDGRGYFAQLHSLVFDLDRDFSNDIAAFAARPSDAVFPLGTAILWAPFYVAAHLWLGLLNLLGAEHVRDGFANPYQRAVGVATFTYGLAALALIAKSLRRTFDRATTLFAVAAILLATPVVWYLTVDASMSHGVSVFAVTLFLSVWVTTREARTRWQWVALGITGLLMATVRLQNAGFIAVLLADPMIELFEAWRSGNRLTVIRSLRWIAALGAAGAVLAAGWLLVSPTAATYILRQGLFSGWMVGPQLFSPHHGLISSTPLVLFALAGFVPLTCRDRALALAFTTVVALQVLAGGTSDGWNAGASFGARRFVSCALPFSFGLAAAIAWARKRPMVPIAVLIAGCTAVNLALVDAARRGELTLSEPVPFSRMVAAVSDRVGNPFALPGALLFSWRHDLPIAYYDRIPARRYSRLRVEIGTPPDEDYLIGEWFDREVSPEGPFRWASGPEAGIFTQVRGHRYLLRFEAQPFEWPGSPPQVIDVYLGGEQVGSFEMDSGLRSYELRIADEQMPADGWMRIAFRFGRATAPRDVTESEDARPLAALFYSVELEPY